MVIDPLYIRTYYKVCYVYVGLLSSMDLASEINKLHDNRGLGSPRHRKQVELFLIETVIGVLIITFLAIA